MAKSPKKSAEPKGEKNKPIHIERGGVKVTIYETPEEGRRRDGRFIVGYYIGGVRKLKRESTIQAARDFANAQIDYAIAGRKAVAEMTEDDREAYVMALAELQPLGISLISAVKDFAAATKIMGDHGSLVTAAKDYVERIEAAANTPLNDLAVVVEEYVEKERLKFEKNKHRRRDYQTVRSHCRQFKKRFRCAIQQIKSKDIVDFLDDNSQAEKSRNNKRTSLVRLFRFAKLRGYLPEEKLTAPELVRPVKVARRDVHALPPSTLRTLLDKAMEAGNKEAALYFAFGAFTGMRTSELHRFHWDHCKMPEKPLARKRIDLPKWVTKTNRARSLPMQPVLLAWIKTLGGPGDGLIFRSEKTSVRCIEFARPFMPEKPLDELPARKGQKTRPTKRRGTTWWENCMRDSYASYRACTTKSVGTVALELGNSEAMVDRSYFDRMADEEDGKRWFETGPPGWQPPAPKPSAT